MLSFLLSFLAVTTLVGQLTDNAGKPVTGATVRIVVVGTPPLETVSDSAGRFRFEVSGPFQLEISHPSYRSVQTSPAELPSEGVYEILIQLLPGSPSQIDRVDFQVENPAQFTSRDGPGVREGLPKADRLFGLRGGVNVTGIGEGSGQQWVAASGNAFTSSSMAAAVADNPNFSAELGDSNELDDALPAGQDVLHGSAYYFYRNNLFNARNFFDPPNTLTPPFQYHFLGADTGGRVRDGTYFFLEYWGLRIGQSIARAATVPDPRWLEGDFSSLPELILDPETGFPFAGNKIPKERFHPLGTALARLYPSPNVPGTSVQNYRAVGKVSTNADSFGVRFDHRLTVADESSLEYTFARDTTDDPFNLLSGITNLPSFGVRDALQTHSLRLNNTHVFSPALIHQLRFAMNFLKQPRTILQSETSAAPGPAILITGLSNLGYATNVPQQRRNRSFELSTDFSWTQGATTTKWGGTVRYFPFSASLDLYSRGQFQFTGGVFARHPFANLLLGVPTNALRLQGNTSRNFRTWTTSFFVQHDWQPLPRLVLNAGLRYDYQSPFSETNGLVANFNPETGQVEKIARNLYKPDRNNIAPRVGLTWRGPSDVLVRAGYGIFYDILAVGDSLFLLGLNPPLVQFALENNGPVLPRFNLDNAFAEGTATRPPSIFAASSELPNPYLQHWSLSLEKSLLPDMTLSLSYFGQKGTRLRRQVNLNQPTPGPAGTLDERRPFPAFRNIFQFETSASSIGHGAEARLVRQFRTDFDFEAAYRFSRLIDDATLISVLPQDSHNLHGERGLADFHVKHRVLFSASYNLPSVGEMPAALQGWQLQALGRLQSGMPLSAVLGDDYTGTGSPIVNRPDLVGNPNIDNGSPSRFLDPAAFRVPAAGRFGNSGRNVIIGPGIRNVDLALTRMFRISDVTRLQFRADAYNVFNHPNFVAPPSTQNFADSPDFGVLFVARSPRILQFGLKLLW